MSLPREIVNGVATGLASAWARPRHTLLIAFGFIVGGITLAVLLTLPAGLEQLAGNTGSADIAVVLSGNVFTTESGASFKPEMAALVSSLPGVAHDREGKP